MWLWLLPIVGGLAFLAAFGRYNSAAAVRGWEGLLTGQSYRALAQLEEHIELDAVLAARAHNKAVAARERLQIAEAVRMLDLASHVIENAIPDRLVRLRGMAVCSRMAAAIMPMPPLLPPQFRLAHLVHLTSLGVLCHHLLVGMQERFALRLWMLSLCYRTVGRTSVGAARAVSVDLQRMQPWTTFDAALADFRTLDREHLASFRALLLSLVSAEG